MSAGKGPGVAQGYRSGNWETSNKLWENLKKKKKEKEDGGSKTNQSTESESRSN